MPVFAGQLEDFESDAAKQHQPRASRTSQSTTQNKASAGEDFLSDAGDECIGQCIGDMFSALFEGVLSGCVSALAAGGSESRKRIDADGTAKFSPDYQVRKKGEALLPFLRLDALYQNVEGDVTATDLRFEAGYGPLGIQIRRTVYDEADPITRLEIREYYFLYRMSYGSQWEIDLGAGGMALSGNQDNNGFSVTIPVLYHPSEFFGIEFRPAWSSINENSIQDMDLAVLLGTRYISVKAGYRWMRSPHQSLDGPEIGLSVRW